MCRSSLAVVFAAAASSCAHLSAFGGVTTWSFGSAHVQYVGGTVENPQWLDYPSTVPTIASAPLTEGIRLTSAGPGGTVFSLQGSEFNPGIEPGFGVNRLFLTGTGTVDDGGWLDPEYFITTQFRAAVSVSGGLFNLYLVETEFSLLDSEGVFLSGVGSGVNPGVFGPGVHPIELTTIDVFNQDHPEARLIRWSLSFEFNWTGFSPSDTLVFSMPGQGIEIVTNVPGTGTAFVFTAAVASATLGRRRGHGRVSR